MSAAVADSSARFLGAQPVPPHGGRRDFSLYLWNEVRSHAILPTFHAGMAEDEQGRLEFLTGARLMGFELEEFDPERRLRELTDPAFAAEERVRRRAAGYFEQLMPQQLAISDTLDMDLSEHVIEISRRGTKTTSIFLKLLGRCALRPGYQVTFSAQSGVAGSRRLREWANRLDAQNPPDDLDMPPWMRGKRRTPAAVERQMALFELDVTQGEDRPTSGRGFKIMRGEVGKGIYFDNGAQFLVLKPDADSYRGEGADASWLDELQEVDPDEGDDLMAGILPLQDTKIGAQTIASGTAGEARVGPFWAWLKRLRAGDDSMGGMDYAVPEDTPWELVEDEETAMELLVSVHPGVGTLTTLDKMRKNYRGLPKPQWAREYLSIWPETFGESAIDPLLWEQASLDKKPAIPSRVAFGLAIKPGGSVTAICAAWRSSTGRAYVELIEHRPGTDWLPERLQELTQKYRGSSVAYDDIAEGKATAGETLRLSPRPRLKVQTYRENAAGCIQLVRELERGKLRHSGQVGLDAAAAVVTRREVRGDQGVWLWNSPPGADITPIDAATRALRNWDQHYARSTGGAGVITA